MAEKYEVEVFIEEDGSLSMRIKGIKGRSCVDKLKNLAGQVGDVGNITYTSEYYEQNDKTNQITKQKT